MPRSTRAQRAAIAQETVLILTSGVYTTPNAEVSIRTALYDAITSTQHLLPTSFDALPTPPGVFNTYIEVRNETTISGARALLSHTTNVCMLNFASARNPGGGFSTGAGAQEESLARASGLYLCLESVPEFYRAHKSGDCLYSHRMIYSPKVPFFCDIHGVLLDEPWHAAVISAPAVNAAVVLRRDPERRDEVEQVMRERVEKVLRLAAGKGHTNVVLGAWGCGVFGNEPSLVASLFAQALRSERFRGVFERVRFSVLDWSRGEETLEAFKSRLGAE